MARFKYIARSRKGERVEGLVDSNDRSGAAQLVESMGYIPVSIDESAKEAEREEHKKKRFSFELGFQRKTKMKLQDLLFFSRELSDLTASGMMLGRALHILSSRKHESSAGRIVKTLRDEIVQGASLSDALELYPGTFSPFYINLIRAGEASGGLSSALETICIHYERVQQARSKIKDALAYPICVLLFAGAVVIFLMAAIVPKFKTTFDEMGATLPRPTLVLMAISDFVMKYGLIAAGAAVLAAIGLGKWIKQSKGRKLWHGAQLRIPLISGIVTANAYAHFSRTLGTLLHNGVSVLQALNIVQKTMGNVLIADEIEKARDRVTDGATISKPLEQGKIFPRLLTDMLAVGEESGNMAGALSHITRRYDAELDRMIKMCTTYLEPLLLVFVAIVVGSVVFSLLLPVLTLTDSLHI